MAPVTHVVSLISNDAPVTVPIPRSEGIDWPGSGEVAYVPVALILAARGCCSCATCTDGFVRLLARTRLQAV